MSKIQGRLVRVSHSEPNKIHLKIRTKDGKKSVTVNDFKPYFYIQDDDGEYVTSDGNQVKKVEMKNYSQVPKKRSMYDNHYEADIPFVRRFLIDKDIRSGVKCPNHSIISHEEIESYDVDIKPRICYLDIEVEMGPTSLEPSKAEEEIISCSVYDSYTGEYFTLINSEEETEDKNARCFETESNLLDGLEKLFKKIEPDLIVGWNIDYDVEYLNNRLEKQNKDFQIRQEKFDLYNGYETLKDRPSYRLDDVLVYEGYTDERPNLEEIMKEFNKGNLKPLTEYNKDHDVGGLVYIDDKHEVTKFFTGLKDLSGLGHYGRVFQKTPPIDSLLLRKAKHKRDNLVLPSTPDDNEKRKRRRGRGKVKQKYGNIGGRVTEPPRGEFENVAVFDMSRYYPSIVLSWNLSPEVDGPDDELGLLPELCLDMLEEREKLEDRLEELEHGSEEWNSVMMRRTNVKYTTNAVFGYTGYPPARYYDESIMTKITEKGREGIKILEDIAEDGGYKSLYSDTDGVFISVPLSEAENLREEMNEGLKSHFEDKYDVDTSYLHLDFEKFYEKLLLTGKKKQYAGRVTYDGDECDYIDIKHFLSMDRSEYARDIYKKALKMIVYDKDKDEIKDELIEMVEKFEEQSLDNVYFTKGLRKRLDEYKGNSNHVRAAVFSNSYLGCNFGKGSRPKLLWTNWVKDNEGRRHNQDIVAFESEPPECSVDWDRMIDSQLGSQMEDILEIVGLDWKEIEMKAKGQTTLI